MGADVAAGLLGTILLLAQVTLIAGVVADVMAGSPDGVPARLVLGLVAVIALRAALAHVVEWSGRHAAGQVMSGLRRELATRYLSPNRPQQADVGDLATTAVQGVDALETYFARYLPQVVLSVTVPIAVLLWTAVVDPLSAVIMVVTLPAIPVFMVLLGRAAARRSHAHWEAMVTLSAHFLDVVQGLATLRAFNRGRAQIPKIAASTEEYRRTTMSTLRLAFLSGVVLDLAITLSTAFVAVTLGVRLVDGDVRLGPALTVLLLVPELYMPIRQVGSLFHASADGLAGARRILDLLDEPTGGGDGGRGIPATPDGPRPASTVMLPSPSEHPLRLDHVTVTYPGRSSPALADIDLEIAPGELLVLGGPSGGGKTTLGRTLVGLTRPTSGSIWVGDHQLQDEDLDQWRHLVSWSPQRALIVHDSAAANIALGRPDATQDEIEAAARAAGAHEVIGELADGYATILGGGGRGLSTGQRQRIGLARALLRDAPLLVLDEPTAHLDPASEEHVLASIEAQRGSRTIVLITHSPSLLTIADRQLHLAGGRVAAEGVAS